jgi:HK97 family phage portal protein
VFNPFKIFRKKNSVNSRDLQKIFGFGGESVVSQNATAFASIDLICSAFASLSGHVYGAETREQIKYHPLNTLLRHPNIDEDHFTFFYNSAKDYYGNGNVYYYKYYNDEGELLSLFRLNPSAVKVTRDPVTNQKLFTYSGQTYTSDTILHIASRYGYNGLIGTSIFSECKDIFNLAYELDAFTNVSFNNSIGKRLIIDITKEYPDVTKEQIEELKRMFIENYAKVRNAGVPLIKHGKIDYSVIDSEVQDNRASQLIENRQFGEKEISKLFGVPLSFLNGDIKGDLESLYTFFIEGAIRPLATTFEEAINRLIPYEEREDVYFEYSYNSLMKTSLQTRIDTYSKQIINGILSINEVRKKENLPGVEAGNTNFVQANLMPLRQDIIDNYMASAKLKGQDLENNDHPTMGDDKGL